MFHIYSFTRHAAFAASLLPLLFLLLGLSLVLLSCNSKAQSKVKKDYPVTKSEAEWKAELTDIQYYVLREAGTERAFSSEHNKNYEAGTYVCAACQTPLFRSEYKFDSGTG